VVGRPKLWATVAVLGVHNVVGNLWLPQWAYLPANLLTGTVIVILAVRSGVDAEDIAGPRPWMGRGGRAAIVAAGCGVAAVCAIAMLPVGGDLFGDTRVLGVGSVGLVYRAAIRIPIGTALFEELAFRGVIPALGRQVGSHRWANLLAATLFGLWHVIPAAFLATDNQVAGHLAGWAVVIASVAATALIGLGFSAMRDRWGLVVPVATHAAVNVTAFVIAWAML